MKKILGYKYDKDNITAVYNTQNISRIIHEFIIKLVVGKKPIMMNCDCNLDDGLCFKSTNKNALIYRNKFEHDVNYAEYN